MTKEEEIMEFLHQNVFDPILNSNSASNKLKQGFRYTIMRMERLDASEMIQYYWSAIIGTDRSIGFSEQMRAEGFTRFEEVIDDFRRMFNDNLLRN